MEAETRPGWRNHPLMKRLPVLVFVGLGLWLWQNTGAQDRELVWRLDGSGWSAVRAMDFQVMAPDGTILRRVERLFSAPPPSEVTLEMKLEEGAYRTLIFVKEEGQPTRPPLVQTVTVGQDKRVLQTLRLPASR